MKDCENCNNSFEADRKERRFCSLSCSAAYNNSLSPKRVRSLNRACQYGECSKPVVAGGTFYTSRCVEHRGKRNTSGAYDQGALYLTLEELRKRTGYYASERFSKYLRGWARDWAKIHHPKIKCSVCGYSKHAVVAHIKPLSDFAPQDRLIDTLYCNLIRLCPNHHWEFDHDGLEIKLPPLDRIEVSDTSKGLVQN